MSPSAALHDPVFREYVGLVTALLLVVGLLLAVLQFIFRIELGSVWKTYRSWLWMAPLAALVIFAGRIVFIASVGAVVITAFREFVRAFDPRHDPWKCAAVCAGMIGVAISLGILAFSPNAYGYLCFVFLATEVNDVAAFTFGRIFGRHPLAAAISPCKTWEGSLGAFLLALVLPWLLRFSFPFFGPRELILSGLIVGLGGQLGDLVFSSFKREFGVKDWGTAIPGHGGVLDRIDSLIFVAPLFMQMTEYYYPGR
ncbi:MAG TPA: phosphatidate cytidylyltransferase [Chthoniobacterales bacterium]|jgi:phosphatidate cytidylyltransferase|nr:phosphatidate cytidylyltransferase [Chthoniobacterales bacterium]